MPHIIGGTIILGPLFNGSIILGPILLWTSTHIIGAQLYWAVNDGPLMIGPIVCVPHSTLGLIIMVGPLLIANPIIGVAQNIVGANNILGLKNMQWRLVLYGPIIVLPIEMGLHIVGHTNITLPIEYASPIVLGPQLYCPLNIGAPIV